jgi:hypothetical protein
VAALSDCTVQVRFAPTAAGSAATTLSLQSAGGATLASVGLTRRSRCRRRPSRSRRPRSPPRARLSR